MHQSSDQRGSEYVRQFLAVDTSLSLKHEPDKLPSFRRSRSRRRLNFTLARARREGGGRRVFILFFYSRFPGVWYAKIRLKYCTYVKRTKKLDRFESINRSLYDDTRVHVAFCFCFSITIQNGFLGVALAESREEKKKKTVSFSFFFLFCCSSGSNRNTLSCASVMVVLDSSE